MVVRVNPVGTTCRVRRLASVMWFALPGSKNMCASVFSNRSRGTPLPGGVWCVIWSAR